MTRFRTLRGRLTAFALLATTVAVALVVVAFNVTLATSLNKDVNSRLRAQAAAALTTVAVEEGKVTVREAPNDGAIDAQVWVFQGGRPVLRPHGAATLQRAAGSLIGRSRKFREVRTPDVRLYALPVVTEGGMRVGTVVAGQSLTAYDRTTDFALIGTIALALFVLAAVFAVTWFAIGRALLPVADMTRSAGAWSEHEPERRFGVARRPDELGELARTFDALLDRVAASLRHEQRLSAELSHELRTPLARIIAEMELLRRRERSSAERERAFEVVSRSAEQMSRILETLMAAARSKASPHPGRSDLAHELPAIATQWADPLIERGLELKVRPVIGPLIVGVDSDLVERVVAPLLDNASRYAQSQVTVDAWRRGTRVRIEVRDDGPGIDANEAERIFEPGVRGERVNGHGGAGLGLALSRRLARTVGGDVSAATGRDGGATLVVELPT